GFWCGVFLAEKSSKKAYFLYRFGGLLFVFVQVGLIVVCVGAFWLFHDCVIFSSWGVVLSSEPTVGTCESSRYFSYWCGCDDREGEKGDHQHEDPYRYRRDQCC